LDDITLHDLRHSHASILLAAGFDLSVIGKALGHTQLSTTMRYAHLQDETLKAAIARVGELAGPKKLNPKTTEQ
jgi:site-specific recombinase XerD